MTEASILVVEDDAQQRELVADILVRQGYRVSQAEGQDQAQQLIEASPPDLVLSDWKLNDGDGMSLLQWIRQTHPMLSFVMATAYGSIAHAVEAVQAGADDYLSKPFERQALLLSIQRTLKTRSLAAENRRLSEQLSERDRLVDIVGRAPSMQRLYRRIEKIADTEATVLLTGESGTGKELVARAIHQLSSRNSGPFVAVNCAAIPEGLMEAEFLGAEKGAYTGAHAARAGKFEAARGGTLFLDEIGELPLSIQPKLLRALQEGSVTRVGGNREIATDVRIVAATNRELAEEVRGGQFREDLFYRLNVVPIQLPALRERTEDIPALVDHFRARTSRLHGIEASEFPRPVMRRMMDYAWPGNVRELGNAVERLILLSDEGEVSMDDLPAEFGSRLPIADATDLFTLPPGGVSWESLEKSALEQALEISRGNRSQAAKLLDLSYKTFLYRLQKHDLDQS
ncbi:MAG: sigma-54 dependent transcriptional regulator [Xanthomonadales bacterium]|nr:sigma-54 dependent transcriptional regulator [Xanthomonadales bacterium]